MWEMLLLGIRCSLILRNGQKGDNLFLEYFSKSINMEMVSDHPDGNNELGFLHHGRY